MSDTVSFFVYGTLKRDECRGSCWPVAPISIEAATMLGRLYDLGPYPAMTPGENLIAGECWTYAARDEEAVLAALDMIEGYTGSPDHDLYTRVQRPCQLDDGTTKTCWTYHYNGVPEGSLMTGDLIRWSE